MLMIIIGLGTILLAMGIAVMGSAMPVSQYPADLQQQIQRIEAEIGVSWTTFLKIAGGIVATPAVLMVVLGFFVRRGSMVSAILGVVLTSLMALYVGSVLVQSLVALITGRAQGTASPFVFCLAALALLGLQLFWLAKAVINAGPLKVFNQQYQAMQLQQRE